MTLTPADIHNREFSRAPLARRGYDEDEVDTLLDEVVRDMVTLLDDNDALQRRLHDTRPAPGADPAGGLAALAAELDRARTACREAEQGARVARHRLDEARRAASAVVAAGPARPGAGPDPVVTVARRTADEHLRRADEESRALLADAQDQVGRTLDEARDRAAGLERDMRRHERDAADALAADSAARLRDIAEMTRFAAEYRAALLAQVTRQGRLLDGAAGPRP